MKKEEWQKVKEIFAVAVEQPVALRSQFLREACGEDDFLRREVESLLEASDETEQLIEKNAIDLASRFQQTNIFEGKQFGSYRIIREISYSKLAASSINSKKFREAAEYAEKALAIYAELERNEPRNLTYKRNLALAYTRLGDAKHQLRDLPGALKSFETALSNLETLVQSDAQATVSLRDIALVCKNIGWIHEDFAEITGGQTREKHLQTAKQNYQRALDILNKLKAENSFAEFDNEFLKEMQESVEKYEKKR